MTTWRDDPVIQEWTEMIGTMPGWPNAMEASVRAYRRWLASEVERLPIESPERSDRNPNARYEITAEAMRAQMLRLIEQDKP